MGSTSPKNKLSIAPLPVNCVMTAVFQDGSLPFQHTHKHSSPFHQVTYTQIANHYNQQARNLSVLFLFVCLFVYFKRWRISSKFRPATWKCHQTTTKGCMSYQRDTPPCWFWCHHGKWIWIAPSWSPDSFIGMPNSRFKVVLNLKWWFLLKRLPHTPKFYYLSECCKYSRSLCTT